jgi:hypothetical protein
MGLLRRAMKQPKEALADLDLLLKHLHAVLKRDPRSLVAADILWRVYYHRALALTDLKRHAEAAADWEQFVLVAPAEYRPFGRVPRADSLARAGQVEQAMKEAEAVGRLPKLPGDLLYDLARVASLCSAGVARDAAQPLARREHLAEARARRAVAWLQAAHQAGQFKTKANRLHMSKDADLDPLRQRDDFKAFIAGLSAGDR